MSDNKPCSICELTEFCRVRYFARDDRGSRYHLVNILQCIYCGQERLGKKVGLSERFSQMLELMSGLTNTRRLLLKRESVGHYLEYEESPVKAGCSCGPYVVFSWYYWGFVEVPADPTVRLYLNGARRGQRVHAVCGKQVV